MANGKWRIQQQIARTCSNLHAHTDEQKHERDNFPTTFNAHN